MKIHNSLPAVCAGCLVSATAAFAATQSLSIPPPSGFVDAESSVVQPFPTNEGRRVKLTLVAPVAPTNAIQVAFGRDLNIDGDLQPEETALVLGVDCGVPFVREEGGSEKVGGESRCRVVDRVAFGSADQPNGDEVSHLVENEGDHLSSPSPSDFDSFTSTYAFTFTQPYALASRYTHAKVTTRNMAETNAVIVAEVNRPGLAILVR